MINPKIKTYLDRLASSPKKPNSFLFFGSSDAEKEEAAFYFILKLVKKENDTDFLKSIQEDIHPDVVVIEPEIVEDKKGKSREKEILIDQIREAQKRLKFFPYELEKKFCVIKKAHKLNAESSNALLKTLEEPTESTFFLLLAQDIDSVLPTISSRCAVMRFPETELPTWKEVNREKLRNIFLEDVHEKLYFAEKISKDKSVAIGVLEDWEAVMAEGLRNLSGGDLPKNRKKIEITKTILQKNREAINRIEKTNASPRAILENLFLELQWK